MISKIICRFLLTLSFLTVSLISKNIAVQADPIPSQQSANALSHASISRQKTVLIASPQQIKKLSEKRLWRKLLHYTNSTPFFEESEVDDVEFFLSPYGKKSRYDELLMTIKRFNEKPESRCQFPARYEWISHELNVDSEDILAQCPELAKWYKNISPYRMTLIFPASYMNSPSSMFGHLFLRVDPGEKRDDLLAFSINYGATINNTDNDIVFAYKGLFGGYPGVASIIPYYEKVKEYNDIENRDIWEYPLKLSQVQVRRLLLHIWELKNIYFDYYFFDENCAYRILSLLEIASPEINALDQFATRAIPSDIVKVLADSQLFDQPKYRPSLATRLEKHRQELSDDERETVLQIISSNDKLNSPQFKRLTAERQAAIIEVATEYMQYRLVDQTSTEETSERGYALLSARSKIPIASPLSTHFTPPKVRNEQGHNTSVLKTGYLSRGKNDYLSLLYRPAYHSLVDPLPGYLSGAQIKFAETEVTYGKKYTVDDDKHWQLENFTLLNIMSLSPRNDFFKPTSWQVDLGVKRINASKENSQLMSHLLAGGGLSYGSKNNQAYLLLNGELLLDSDLDSQYSFRAGMGAGWILNSDNSQSNFQINYLNDTGRDHLTTTELAFSHTQNIATDHALNLLLQRTKIDDYYESKVQLTYSFFF